ncbi:MAG: class I SAM-dependent methyltransferase [Candidatus Kariarchaeaceae archaeon]
MYQYNTIGRNYDNTRVADRYISQKLVQLLFRNKAIKYLDLGCGSGNYTFELAKQLGKNMFAIDQSNLMIDTIRKKRLFLANWVQFNLGDAHCLPFKDNSFDGIFATNVLHHLHDKIKALIEVYRILRPDGRIAIFGSTKEQIQNYWLDEYFPQGIQKAITRTIGKEKLKTILEFTKFKSIKFEYYEVKDTLEDLFFYSGKNKPEIYLDANIRKGMSPFASLISEDELQRGLGQLKQDIQSGKIWKVIERYRSDTGDYSFVSAEK